MATLFLITVANLDSKGRFKPAADGAGAAIVPFFTFHGCRHTFGTRLGQAGKTAGRSAS